MQYVYQGGSGVVYGPFDSAEAASAHAAENGRHASVYAFEDVRRGRRPARTAAAPPAGSWAAFQALGQ